VSSGVTLMPWNSLFQKTLIIASKNRTVRPGDAFQDTDFKVWDCQILNYALESQLFTFSWNIYFPDGGDLSASFSVFYSCIPVSRWKANQGSKMSRNSRTRTLFTAIVYAKDGIICCYDAAWDSDHLLALYCVPAKSRALGRRLAT
jgi:hypothetical protein